MSTGSAGAPSGNDAGVVVASGGQPAGSGGSNTGTAGLGGNNTSSGGASATGGTAGAATVGSGGITVAGGAGGGPAGGTSPGSGGASGGSAAPSTGGAPVVACQAPVAVTGTAATVSVNLAGAPLATVGPDLMGIHTSVYDGNMQAVTTPDLLKAAGVTSLRYPGGSYADSYHWELNTGTFTPTVGAGSNEIYIAAGADFGSFVSGILKNTGANALISVNYGTNSAGNGPGTPQAAAAWVAYANSLPTNATVIGVDSGGKDWKTAGYWASLRAAAPLPVDDGQNFLRISRADPVGIKYWEVGNEVYGNGYYYGPWCGWEPDMHLAYPGLTKDTVCTNRGNNPALSPRTYGMAVKAFATAMKAVDPTVKVGGIVHWPYNEYAEWNGAVLPEACAAMDFAVNHWYAGSSLTNLLTVPRTDIPAMYKDLRIAFTTAANGCGAKGATLPLAVTEWGPSGQADIQTALNPPDNAEPTHTQIPGIFAAESYANFMEQGALSVHWLELHSRTYLGDTDTGSWGYKGAQMAHYLAAVGDALIPTTVAGAAAASILSHASKHTNGSVSVMLTNISPSAAAAVTVNVTGITLACVGTRYAYTPIAPDMDGPVTTQPIFSATTGGSVTVSVPAYSVVVVAFPPK